jgi:hypothetical protein
MADWATISSLATAGGTLVLAIATFASVRSANRAARTAERAFQVGMRPILGASRLTDPDIKMSWMDDHRARVGGGRASIEIENDRIYVAMSLRNVGSGIGVMQAWNVEVDRQPGDGQPIAPEDRFRRQGRDLYISSGDVGFWQAAIRDPNDPLYPGVRSAIKERRPILIDVLYSNDEGDQRAITQFVVNPVDDGGSQWLCAVGRHRNLDRPNPR